jgi:hypothetical protein
MKGVSGRYGASRSSSSVMFLRSATASSRVLSNTGREMMDDEVIAMNRPTTVQINYKIDHPLREVDVTELTECLFAWQEELPDIGEAVIRLNDVEYFVTFETIGDLIQANVLPRDFAEVELNKIGLTTQEPFLPPMKMK